MSGSLGMRLRTAIMLALLTFACGEKPQNSNGFPNNETRAVTFHEDIKPVVDAYCSRCHTDGGPAPFKLESYEEVASAAALVLAAVEARTMPPFLAAPAVRPLKFDTSLSDAQIALFRDWIEAGRLEGAPASAGVALDLPGRSLSRTDLSISMVVMA